VVSANAAITPAHLLTFISFPFMEVLRQVLHLFLLTREVQMSSACSREAGNQSRDLPTALFYFLDYMVITSYEPSQFEPALAEKSQETITI
jgi:hypothetical protein